jgi:hypothetical protein
MSTRKHRKLKRHPIVRFMRGIFRLFRVLFRPKRTLARLELPRPVAIEERIESTSFDRSFELDRLVTVGEILGGVKWQSPPPTIQKELTNNSSSRIPRPQDVSRN